MQKIFADVAAGVTKEVYLASEVDEFLAGINDADDARDEVIRKEIAAKDARIGELENQLKVAADALSKAGYVRTAAALAKSLMER